MLSKQEFEILTQAEIYPLTYEDILLIKRMQDAGLVKRENVITAITLYVPRFELSDRGAEAVDRFRMTQEALRDNHELVMIDAAIGDCPSVKMSDAAHRLLKYVAYNNGCSHAELAKLNKNQRVVQWLEKNTLIERRPIRDVNFYVITEAGKQALWPHGGK